jgi:chemotaxis protein MotB
MITLLLVFFILLASMSQLKLKQLAELMTAFRQVTQGASAASHHHARLSAPATRAPGRAPSRPASRPSLYEQLKAIVERDHLGNLVELQQASYGVNLYFLPAAYFASGHASLSPSTQAVLKDLTPILARIPNTLVLQGYADKVPIDTQEYHSNWDLSGMRAARVADALMADGINPHRMIVEGYGRWHPIASNRTPQGEAANRTVRLVIVNRSLSYRSLAHGH